MNVKRRLPSLRAVGYFANPEVCMDSIQMKVLLIVAVPLLVLACGGKGGDDDKKKPSNKWDEMKWDKGEWGAVESRPYRILIS